jgi:hypothetical protein
MTIVKTDEVIRFSDDKHPRDWFRFKEPFESPNNGKSYVSIEDMNLIILELNQDELGAAFYRIHGNSGNYHLTPVKDDDLVKKLAEHRMALIQAREHDKYISSTNPAAPFLGSPLRYYPPRI